MMNNASVLEKRMSHFFGIGLILAFILPHTSTALLLVNPLLCLFFLCYKYNRVWYKKNWLVLLPLLITLILNVGQDVETKSMLRFWSLILYFGCFPLVGKVKLHNVYLYILLVVIVISQLAYIINISFLTNLLDTFYPIADDNTEIKHMRSTIGMDNMTNYRLGGLYRNANNCARELTMLMATFGIVNKDRPIRRIIPYFLIAMIAIILTGSRTGFAVGGLFLILYFFNLKNVNTLIKVVIVSIMLLGFVFMIRTGSDTYRGINVIEGFSNSADEKFYTFLDYFTHEKNPMALLFGYMDSTRFERTDIESMAYFDCDYGAIIFSYGIVGFISILMFFYSIYKRMNKAGRLFFILLLWMVSSAIICSNRAIFTYMLLLSCIYGETKLKKDTYQQET